MLRMLRNLRLRTKLLTGFILVSLVAGLTGYVGVQGSQEIRDSLNITANTDAIQALLEIKAAASEIEAQTLGFELIKDEPSREEGSLTGAQKYKLIGRVEQIEKWVDRYDRATKQAQQDLSVYWTRSIWDRQSTVVALAFDSLEFKERGISGRQLLKKLDELRQAQRDLRESIAGALQHELTAIESHILDSDVTSGRVIRLNVLITIVALLLALLLAVLLARSISQPITHLTEMVNSLGKTSTNTLDALRVSSDDEVGQLVRAFKQMTQRLQETTVSRDALVKEVTERKNAEDALARQAQENAVVAEIGRIIGSTLDINEVYERCAEQARGLISFDRMIINRVDTAAGSFVNLYESGGQISGWETGAVRPYADTPTEFIVESRKGLILGGESDDELVKRFPSQAASLAAGLGSLVAVPMFSKNETLGSLHFRSRTQNAYSERDLIMAERVAGQIVGAIANSELYKERQHAEEASAKQAKELARSNAELEQFASVATHDLQEPLRKIQTFGDLLATTSSEVLDENARGYVHSMRDASGRMRTLLNDLLSFSRVSGEAQPYAPVHLGRLTQDVLSDLEPLIAETGGRVDVGDLPTIDADPTQMRQLEQNLIGNALKFRRPDEPPVVKIRGRLLDGHEGSASSGPQSDGTWEITVEDNGIGFDEKYLDRIFTVFQRLHGRDTYEGTGIGLATCRKIVERHGGSITAQSRPGEGATFIVTLPAKQRKGESGDE